MQYEYISYNFTPIIAVYVYNYGHLLLHFACSIICVMFFYTCSLSSTINPV